MKIKLNSGCTIEKYNANDLSQEIEWARTTAYKKANHTADTWQGRSAYKRFENIFLGDLAKNIVKRYLLESFPEVGPYLVEYDKSRTDDFKNRDLFDLMIKKGSTSIEIEVKSSGEKSISSPSALHTSRRLIVNQPGPHYHLSDICVQVMFVPGNMSFFKNENVSSSLPIEQYSSQYARDFIAAAVDGYIMGFANLEQQKKALESFFSVNNSGASANRRSYADLILSNTCQPDFLAEVIRKSAGI